MPVCSGCGPGHNGCISRGNSRRLSSSRLQVLLLENIGTSIKVGPDQLPSLHALLTEAASILQMEAPELYVRQVRGVGGSCCWARTFCILVPLHFSKGAMSAPALSAAWSGLQLLLLLLCCAERGP